MEKMEAELPVNTSRQGLLCKLQQSEPTSATTIKTFDSYKTHTLLDVTKWVRPQHLSPLHFDVFLSILVIFFDRLEVGGPIQGESWWFRESRKEKE